QSSFTDTYTLSLHDALPIFLVSPFSSDLVLFSIVRYSCSIFLFFFVTSTDLTVILAWSVSAVLGFGATTSSLSYLTFASLSAWADRKSTRLNSSHVKISYAV